MLRSTLLVLPLLAAACAPSDDVDPITTASVGPVATSAFAGNPMGTIAGEWAAVEDEDAVIGIRRGPSGHVLSSFYEGEALEREGMRFVRDCLGKAAADGETRSFVVGADEPLCYTVEAVGERALVLTELPSGERLVYRRAG